MANENDGEEEDELHANNTLWTCFVRKGQQTYHKNSSKGDPAIGGNVGRKNHPDPGTRRIEIKNSTSKSPRKAARETKM
jgi:hypothetical protein